MFYYIRGKLVCLEHGYAVIDAMGVGYKLTISETTYDALPHKGDTPEVKLLTHFSVREDGVELFGFYTEQELASFKMLIAVSGIGPKAALSVLSTLSPEKFAVAVCTEDRKAISKAPGIGPKSAARIILELKDKLASSVSDGDLADSIGGIETRKVSAGGHLSEAEDALSVLGYSRTEALNALKGIDTSLPVEEVIRLALKKLMR